MLAAGARAQAPTLVKDIWSGPNSAHPNSITAFGDKLLFSASDSLYGQELWEWRIASSTAVRVSDNGIKNYSGCITEARRPMPVFNGHVFFMAYKSASATCLLKYQGTGAPDTVFGSPNMNFRSTCVLGNKLYFFADTATFNAYLWSYDGTNPPVRHRYFKNIVRGGNWSSLLIPYKGKLYFAADTAGFGAELFSFDPLTNTASLVADISKGTKSSDPSAFIVGGGKLYFTATDSAHGEELYSFDGTTTTRLTDVIAGPGSGVVLCCNIGMAYHKGGIFFDGNVSTPTGHAAVFRYDTASGMTMKVCDPFPTIGGTLPQQFLSTPHNLYFYVSNLSAPGAEVWKYNGTVAAMVADLNPGKGNGVFSNLELHEGYVYFAGDNGATGYELYRIQDIPPAAGIAPSQLPERVRLYPNPAISGRFNIAIESYHPASRVIVTVCNILGTQVLQQEYADPGAAFIQQIELTDAAAGTYLAKIEVDGKVAYKRLVVE